MSHPYFHAVSSVKIHGGRHEDYIDIHNWFDATKAIIPDVRHRALRHHSEGIFECERVFGSTIKNSYGKIVPVRVIAEQHVKEDLGRIPTASEWLSEMPLAPWMTNSKKLVADIQLPDNRATFSKKAEEIEDEYDIFK